MQELAGDRLSQAEVAAAAKLDHAPDGLAAVFPAKAAVIGKAGQSGSEHFIDRCKMATRKLPPNNLFVFGLEFHGHNFNVRESGAQCKWISPVKPAAGRGVEASGLRERDCNRLRHARQTEFRARNMFCGAQRRRSR